MMGFRYGGFPKTLSNAVLGGSWGEATKATGPERGQWKWRQRERMPCKRKNGQCCDGAKASAVERCPRPKLLFE